MNFMETRGGYELAETIKYSLPTLVERADAIAKQLETLAVQMSTPKTQFAVQADNESLLNVINRHLSEGCRLVKSMPGWQCTILVFEKEEKTA